MGLNGRFQSYQIIETDGCSGIDTYMLCLDSVLARIMHSQLIEKPSPSTPGMNSEPARHGVNGVNRRTDKLAGVSYRLSRQSGR